MPFKSAKQRRFMFAAANNPKAKATMGISQNAAKRYIAHSQRDTGDRRQSPTRNYGTSHKRSEHGGRY